MKIVHPAHDYPKKIARVSTLLGHHVDKKILMMLQLFTMYKTTDYTDGYSTSPAFGTIFSLLYKDSNAQDKDTFINSIQTATDGWSKAIVDLSNDKAPTRGDANALLQKFNSILQKSMFVVMAALIAESAAQTRNSQVMMFFKTLSKPGFNQTTQASALVHAAFKLLYRFKLLHRGLRRLLQSSLMASTTTFLVPEINALVALFEPGENATELVPTSVATNVIDRLKQTNFMVSNSEDLAFCTFIPFMYGQIHFIKQMNKIIPAIKTLPWYNLFSNKYSGGHAISEAYRNKYVSLRVCDNINFIHSLNIFQVKPVLLRVAASQHVHTAIFNTLLTIYNKQKPTQVSQNELCVAIVLNYLQNANVELDNNGPNFWSVLIEQFPNVDITGKQFTKSIYAASTEKAVRALASLGYDANHPTHQPDLWNLVVAAGPAFLGHIKHLAVLQVPTWDYDASLTMLFSADNTPDDAAKSIRRRIFRSNAYLQMAISKNKEKLLELSNLHPRADYAREILDITGYVDTSKLRNPRYDAIVKSYEQTLQMSREFLKTELALTNMKKLTPTTLAKSHLTQFAANGVGTSMVGAVTNNDRVQRSIDAINGNKRSREASTFVTPSKKNKN